MEDTLTISMTHRLFPCKMPINHYFFYESTKLIDEGVVYMYLKKAMVGDNIVSINGIKGKVEKVGENSVIVEILENISGRNFENNRTVVSHKKYVVL